jgi:hypothetical protein
MIRTTFILLLALFFGINVATAGAHCHENNCCKKKHWKKEWKKDRCHADYNNWNKQDDGGYGDNDYDFKRKDYGRWQNHDEACCFALHGDLNHQCDFCYKEKEKKQCEDHSCAGCHPCDRWN